MHKVFLTLSPDLGVCVEACLLGTGAASDLGQPQLEAKTPASLSRSTRILRTYISRSDHVRPTARAGWGLISAALPTAQQHASRSPTLWWHAGAGQALLIARSICAVHCRLRVRSDGPGTFRATEINRRTCAPTPPKWWFLRTLPERINLSESQFAAQAPEGSRARSGKGWRRPCCRLYRATQSFPCRRLSLSLSVSLSPYIYITIYK